MLWSRAEMVLVFVAVISTSNVVGIFDFGDGFFDGLGREGHVGVSGDVGGGGWFRSGYK